MDDQPLPFIAYQLDNGDTMPIVHAPARRGWMDDSPQGYAYRCLPLVIANQTGWVIENHVEFTAVWNGRRTPADIQIVIHRTGEGRGWDAVHYIHSHFGEGVLTFTIPYLFRTPSEYNLWVRGPANYLKDAIQPLEGIVETDWSYATFTMNWKFTRPNEMVHFQIGEPICQVMPLPRRLVERFEPEMRTLADDTDLAAAYNRWRDSRTSFAQDLKVPETDANRRGWQKEYFQGRLADGKRFEPHQTHLAVKDFVRVADADPASAPAPADTSSRTPS